MGIKQIGARCLLATLCLEAPNRARGGIWHDGPKPERFGAQSHVSLLITYAWKNDQRAASPEGAFAI